MKNSNVEGINGGSFFPGDVVVNWETSKQGRVAEALEGQADLVHVDFGNGLSLCDPAELTITARGPVWSDMIQAAVSA